MYVTIKKKGFLLFSLFMHWGSTIRLASDVVYKQISLTLLSKLDNGPLLFWRSIPSIQIASHQESVQLLSEKTDVKKQALNWPHGFTKTTTQSEVSQRSHIIYACLYSLPSKSHSIDLLMQPPNAICSVYANCHGSLFLWVKSHKLSYVLEKEKV